MVDWVGLNIGERIAEIWWGGAKGFTFLLSCSICSAQKHKILKMKESSSS